MNTELQLNTYPENEISLPLDNGLRRQFKRQGEFNTDMPLPIMRLSVHLATRIFTPKLYKGKFSNKYIHLKADNRNIGLRFVTSDMAGVQPVILYMHGGGGVVADSSSYLRVLKNLSFFCDAKVIAVDYSRAPEHKFSHALRDCSLAFNWVHEHARELKIDPDRITVMGDSAGGNLAASLAIYNRDHHGPHISRQVLINPMTSHFVETQSRKLFDKGFGLSKSGIDFFEKSWIDTGLGLAGCYASPLKSKDLDKLPDALIITSEYDPLRDEGEAYAGALHEAGNKVEAIRYLGMAHAMVVFGCNRQTALNVYSLIAKNINPSFSGN